MADEKGIKNIFSRLFRSAEGEAAAEQEHIVCSMVKILCSRDTCYLKDLLFLMKLLYGESELTIVDTENRQIVESTATAEVLGEIGKTAKSIRNTEEKKDYSVMEKNGLWFRPDFPYIRVVPLPYGKAVPYILIVERCKNKYCIDERCAAALSLGLHLAECDGVLKKEKKQLRSRDALVSLVKDAEMEKDEEKKGYTYIGMMSLTDALKTACQNGEMALYKKEQQTIGELEKVFGEVFEVGDARYAVLFEGEAVDMAAALQDCMDALLCADEFVETAAVMTPMEEDTYRMLYRLEKALADTDTGVVSFVRQIMEDDGLAGGEKITKIFTGSSDKREGEEKIKVEKAVRTKEKQAGEMKKQEMEPEEFDIVYEVPEAGEIPYV